MRLGFAVKVLGRPDLPSHDMRRWQSGPHLRVSIRYLHAILDYLDEIDVRMYRMATGIAPYASHPELTRFRDQPQECASELAEVGRRAAALGIRLSTHPGQYTVLNSEDERVQENAIAELEVQAEIFDGMGLPRESVVVLHVGGKGGGPAAIDRFLSGFERLSDRARARLVLENDDRSFSVNDVVQLSRRTGTPVVWDALHHRCYDPERIPDSEALDLALSTWPPGVTPKVHFSSGRTTIEKRSKKVGRRKVPHYLASPLRAHADLIDPMAFEWFLRDVVGTRDVDVMLEAKGKDIALLTLRRQLAERAID
jgi:UV DNA damage endonuclease